MFLIPIIIQVVIFFRYNRKKIRAVNIKTGEVLTFNSTVEARRKGYPGGHVSSACRGVYKDGGLSAMAERCAG